MATDGPGVQTASRVLQPRPNLDDFWILTLKMYIISVAGTQLARWQGSSRRQAYASDSGGGGESL
jgi:hypothetical protein